MVFDGIGEGVDDLGQDVIWTDEFNQGGLLGGPEILPAPAQNVLMLCEQLVKPFEELGNVPVGVDDDGVIVVGVRNERDDVDLRFLRGIGQAVHEGVVGLAVGPQEELPLCAATSDQIGASRNDLSGG